MIRKLNEFFLADEDEDIHWTDYAWFYGTLIFMLLVGSTTIITLI